MVINQTNQPEESFFLFQVSTPTLVCLIVLLNLYITVVVLVSTYSSTVVSMRRSVVLVTHASGYHRHWSFRLDVSGRSFATIFRAEGVVLNTCGECSTDNLISGVLLLLHVCGPCAREKRDKKESYIRTVILYFIFYTRKKKVFTTVIITRLKKIPERKKTCCFID